MGWCSGRYGKGAKAGTGCEDAASSDGKKRKKCHTNAKIPHRQPVISGTTAILSALLMHCCEQLHTITFLVKKTKNVSSHFSVQRPVAHLRLSDAAKRLNMEIG